MGMKKRRRKRWTKEMGKRGTKKRNGKPNRNY
jgi:hypothetical protein